MAGWLPGERAVNRIPSPLENRSRWPFSLPRCTHRGILLGQTRSQAWWFPPVSGRTTGSALCGGISMGLHKPKESLGQSRVLLRYTGTLASLARSLARFVCSFVEQPG